MQPLGTKVYLLKSDMIPQSELHTCAIWKHLWFTSFSQPVEKAWFSRLG